MTKEEALVQSSKDQTFLKNNEDWNNDYDVCLQAVKSFRAAVPYISYDLRSNKEFALQALQSRSSILRHFGKNLKNDLDVVKLAVDKDKDEFQFVSNSLKQNIEAGFHFITSHRRLFKLLPLSSRTNYDLCALSLNCDSSFELEKRVAGANLEYIPSELIDFDIAIQAMKNNGDMFCFLPENLKDNKEISLIALQTSTYSPKVFNEISDRLKMDIDCILMALESNSSFLDKRGKLVYPDNDFLNRFAVYSYYGNNQDYKEIIHNLNICIANHPDFNPIEDILNLGLKSKHVGAIFHCRLDEWIANFEKDKLTNFIKKQNNRKIETL